MVDEFPTTELISARVITDSSLGDGIVIEMWLQEYEIDDQHGPSPTKRTKLSILARDVDAFELGRSLTFAARYVDGDDSNSG